MSSHDSHILHHLQQIKDTAPADQIARVLDMCGFVFNGEAVQKADGAEFNHTDCTDYIYALDQVMGQMVSSFAKVNFILAGCQAAKNMD